MDLRAYQDELLELAERNDWGQFLSERNLAQATLTEAAELAELYQWGEHATQARAEDEAADVAIFLLQYCDRAGVDLEAAVAAKLRKNWKRETDGPRFKN